MTKKCVITKESPFVFKIILVQGMNRQIRRMCEHFGYEVTKLERTRIMNISLKGIPLGDWRELTEQEMAGIYKMIEKSRSVHTSKNTKTEESSVKKPVKKDNPSNKPFVKSRQNSDERTGRNKSAAKKANHSKSNNKPAKGKAPVKGKSRSPRR